MTKEDGFVEVKIVTLNTGLIRVIRPASIKRVKLLFDIMCWMVVARDSGLDFQQIEEMDPDEFLTWAFYGGYVSHLNYTGKSKKIDVEVVQEWVQGLLVNDRKRILETIIGSRDMGETAKSYQQAMASMSTESKKKDSGDRMS